ncbi:SAM-dependent methyltransferase [Maribacter sp. TH_r10]|uniref:SAM-dependent methyltransferase n=1 Tax=Maribacter sp. TH_r10 TaxID=3082086 RepID=UPI002953BB31|nr:SAM-dependent methyltransferase [Maribacter sp. TH_r10]MDV7138594.1 SAM-dependent methyltransferase [Maribacter sp. TH_r10]|tara:strand:- start:2594 stop:3316 length:723 start_codon:yes stop_codon:yes gene_type:complete
MESSDKPKGKLYLIPTTLGDNEPLEVLPISIKRVIEAVDHYIVENEKSARHFIKKIYPRKSQPSLKIEVLNKYTEPETLPSFLQPCLEGMDVGVISEAGCPGIADPGADVVRIAHQKNIQVVPLVGPSSIVLALMASGLNGQNFAFNGYLPIDAALRKKAIKSLERKSMDSRQSQLFIETPYRNDKLFKELIKTLAKSTKLCIACDITLATEFILTQSISEWQNSSVDLNKRPAIFIIQG